MIPEAFLNLLYGLAETLTDWLASMIPDAPAFWVDAVDAFGRLLALIPAPVLHFIPVRPVLAAGTLALTIVIGVGLVRFGRRILSLFTGGGGNA